MLVFSAQMELAIRSLAALLILWHLSSALEGLYT